MPSSMNLFTRFTFPQMNRFRISSLRALAFFSYLPCVDPNPCKSATEINLSKLFGVQSQLGSSNDKRFCVKHWHFVGI